MEGMCYVTYRISGSYGTGNTAFMRVQNGALSVEPDNGRIVEILSHELLDVGGDEKADYAKLECQVVTNVEGSFTVAGDLVDAAGVVRVRAVQSVTNVAAGARTLTLLFDLKDFSDAGVQGALHIEKLQLFQDRPTGIAWLDTFGGEPYTFGGDPSQTYALSVTDGTGAGDYVYGQIVNVAVGQAPTGKTFRGWIGDTDHLASATAATTTVTMPSHAVSVTANFAQNTYSVVFTAGANGSITGTKSQTVNYGAKCTRVTSAPAANYYFSGWTGDYTGIDNPLTLPNITKNMEIIAKFAHNTSTLTVNANGNGRGEASVENPVNTVTTIPISATPAANNHFMNWTLTSGSAVIADANSVATTVTLNGGHGSAATITANFAVDTIAPTAAPVISATDGTYWNRVVVTWKAVSGATSYKIYRNNLNRTTGIGDPIGETTDCIFEDNTAVYGMTYYYFAKATNSIGDSPKYSAGNSGYVAKAPAILGVVTASDGTYFDKIRVSWAKVTGATSYRVFRTETDTPAPNPALGANLIGETTALFLDDFGDKIAPPSGNVVKKYYYWIAAKNGNAITAISNSNSGYLSKKGPATVSASNGTYSEKIVVTWASVPGATAYDVYRYTDTRFTQNLTKVGDVVAVLECVDSTAMPNILYYYKVKAKYGSGDPIAYKYDSDFSLSGAVGKASGSFSPIATALVNGVQVGNIANLLKSSAYYSMDVPVGTTRLVAALDGTSSLTLANDCDLYAKFANLPTNTSYSAKGVENKFNEFLSLTNPSAGTWYFLLYGYTAYSGVSLTVNCYSVTDIVLTQIPMNDLAVPFTALFKGQVLDKVKAGIPNIVLQARNPITGLTSSLAKTDAKGIFSYSALIATEGEHTFDFFFTEMPDKVKGTASHTVATRKGCFEDNNFFDFSAYLPATPVAVPAQSDITGLQTFLDIRNGWDFTGMVDSGDTYETMWVNSTIVKAGDDAQLRANLDGGLYMFFYGVEGAGVGNDTTTVSQLSAVPFVVHVETTKKAGVLTSLETLGVIDGTQKDAIELGSIGIVAVAALSSPDEATDGYNISLLAREQLEILAKFAAGSGGFVENKTYSGVPTKKVTVTLENGKQINIVATVFVKE
jgi:hypothetical protein